MSKSFDERYNEYKRATSSNGSGKSFDEKYKTYQDRRKIKDATKTYADSANVTKKGFDLAFNQDSQNNKKQTTNQTTVKKPTTTSQEFDKFDTVKPKTKTQTIKQTQPTTSVMPKSATVKANNPFSNNLMQVPTQSDYQSASTTYQNRNTPNYQAQLENNVKLDTLRSTKAYQSMSQDQKKRAEELVLTQNASLSMPTGKETAIPDTTPKNAWDAAWQADEGFGQGLRDKLISTATIPANLGPTQGAFPTQETGRSIMQRQSDALRDYLGPEDYASEAQKAGFVGGQVTGEVAQMLALNALSGGMSNAVNNPVVNAALKSAATGAANSVVNSMANRETIQQGAKNAARDALFFGVGSLGSQAAGAAIDKALFANGAQNSTRNYVLEQLAKGTAFSAAGEAATYPTYSLMGDEAPSIEQIGTNMLTGMIFDTVSGLMALPKLKANSKAVIDNSSKQLVKGLELLDQVKGSNIDDKLKNTIYENMLLEIDRTRTELNNTRLVGEDIRVNQYNQILDFVENDVKKQLAGYYTYRPVQNQIGTNTQGQIRTVNRPLLENQTSSNVPSTPIESLNARVQAPQLTPVARNTISHINNTTQNQNSTQTNLKQNTGNIKNVAVINDKVSEIGNKELSKAIDELNPQERTVYKMQIGDNTRYVNITPSPENNVRVVSFLNGEETKPYENLETINVSKMAKSVNETPKNANEVVKNVTKTPKNVNEVAKTGSIESGEMVIFKNNNEMIEGKVQEIDTLYNEATIESNGQKYYVQLDDLKRPGESLEVVETKADKLRRMEDKYAEPTLTQRANAILASQERNMEETRAMMEQSKQVVDIVKEGKKGRSSKKYYLSPELAGVDNIKSLSNYMTFTDDPKATSIDVMQMEVANRFPEVENMGIEEFGQWLVDNVDSYRNYQSELKEQELTYDETFKKLKIDTKTMGNIDDFKQAVEEIESSMSRIPFSLQFFSQKTVDSYKTLIKQLEREGVSKALLEEVKQLGKDFKASEASLKREKERTDKKIESLIEKQKSEKQLLKEKLTRQKQTAVKKAHFEEAITKQKLETKLEETKAKSAKALKEEKVKRQIDRFKAISKENRQEVRKKYKELVKIAKERNFKMNPETKAAVNELINFIQGKQIGDVSALDMNKFNKALDNLATYEDTPISTNLKSRLETIKTTTEDMTYDDFIEVYNMVKIVVNQNKYVNKLMTAQRYKSINEAVKEVQTKFKVKHRKLGRGIKTQKSGVTTRANHLGDKITLSQLTIKNLVSKLEGTQGGPLKTILYDNIVKGHTVKYDYLKRSMDFFSSKLENVDLKAIDKGSYELSDTEGNTIKISSLEKIAIALNSYNAKNRYALVNGGVVRKNTNKLIKIDDTEVETLVASLNANEKQIVDTVLEYFSTLNQEQINKLTMKMFNYEGAKEENYYPKKVAKAYTRVNETHTLEEESGLSNLASGNLENAGFLKPKTLTKTPILLENPFEVVFQMMNDTAELSAYAPALRDARVMLKKLQPFITENYSDVMYRQLSDYVTAMNKPNNIRVESDDLVNTLYNNVVTSVFGLNLSTSAKQPLGLINAATEIEGKYLLKAATVLPGQMKKEVEKVYEYAPYLWYRGQGNVNRDLSETNIHKGINKTFYSKKSLRDYATYHITKTDMYVALRIWKASEYKVKAETNLRPGSEEFYKKVGEMATEITLTTQGNGEITHRSQIMRSDNIWKKSFTSFQGQAQTCFNQLDNAYEEFKETKRLARFTRKALLISIIPAIGALAVGELVKLVMGNDKNLYTKYQNAEKTGVGMEEVRMTIQERLLSEILGINLYTGIAYDAIKSANNFYGSDSNNPLYRELQNLAKGVSYLQNGKADKAYETMSKSLLKLTAIPVDNISKLANMGDSLVNGYDYDLTDKEIFNAYKKEVNSFSNELENSNIEPTKDQRKVIKTFNSYKYDISKLEKTIEETTNHAKKQKYQNKLEELIQKANTYFNENKQYLD